MIHVGDREDHNSDGSAEDVLVMKNITMVVVSTSPSLGSPLPIPGYSDRQS